ncbi:Dynactin subunit 1 [Leucoagaricus sp. SymC.cos]|nr:Dynactin subunit 1 [Leucoagaricus sp. SymC.cos]
MDPPVGSIVTIPQGRGVVRFTGTSSFTIGKWIGVKLYEPSGKNDGSINGIVYFSCKMNYGVFVRQSQIKNIRGTEGKASSSSPCSRISTYRTGQISTPRTSSPLSSPPGTGETVVAPDATPLPSNSPRVPAPIQASTHEALHAEDLLVKLTERNLELGEEIEEMKRTIEDPETLKESNDDELEEKYVETEKQLYDDTEKRDTEIREHLSKITFLEDAYQDLECTISQFRELVL